MLIQVTLILQSKTQDYVPLLSLYQQKTIRNYQKLVSKGFERSHQCIGMNVKQKVRIKIQQMNIDMFLNQTL